MIQSMTGYGAAVASSDNYKVTIELKSLNTKYFEVALKMPRAFIKYENQIRTRLSKLLKRGKVVVFFNVEVLNPAKRTLNINKALARTYFVELEALRKDLGIEKGLSMQQLLDLPEVLPTEHDDADPEEWKLMSQAIDEAAQQLIINRNDEGMAHSRDFEGRITSITSILKEIEGLLPQRLQDVRDRLGNSLKEFSQRADIDKDRLEQELILYIEKLDINEEVVRLKQHLTYFTDMLANDKSNGKQLQFISQEMGREINTIGSKANYAAIQKLVVRMKDELEKIKEQVLNVV